MEVSDDLPKCIEGIMEGDNNVQVLKQKEKRNLPVDSQSQKSSGNKRKKKMNLVSNNNSQTLEFIPKKKKNGKAKENIKGALSSSGRTGSEVFDFDEIAGNKEASALIHELVKCYTNNSLLPPEELHILNQTLYEKTVSVFLFVLNNCVQKIFNKVLNTDYFKELLGKNKVMKKNASCQTEVSNENF